MCASKINVVFLCGPELITCSLVKAREIIAHFHNFSYEGYNESYFCNKVVDYKVSRFQKCEEPFEEHRNQNRKKQNN